MVIKPARCTALLVCLCLLGCTATVARQPDLSDEARIWLNQTAVIEVLQTFASADSLYIHFNLHPRDSSDFKTFYAKASWDNSHIPAVELQRNIVIPLAMINESDWNNRPKDLAPVENLEETHWHHYRVKMAHAITPQEKNVGVVIRSNEDELVLYYDDEESLKVVDLKEKPSAVKIKEILTQEAFAQWLVISMAEYAQSQKIEGQRILLTIDNEDDYANPFLYVDLASGTALNLKLPLEDQAKHRQSLLKNSMKSADYLLLDSYVLGLWKRPISSGLRLFSWAQSTTRDVMKPPSLAVFENKPPAPLYKGEGMDLEAFDKRLNKEVGEDVSSGTMEFLIGGDQFFTSLIDAIIGAQESIEVRIFIFDNDDYAVGIADLLKRKAEEGVKVRVLLDGMGQVMGEGKQPDDLPAGFEPPASMEKYLKKDSNVEVRVRPNTWFKADHTKTIIIDKKFFFTGGMNIGREYRYHWHDLMIKVPGPIVGEILREFDIAWAHAGSWGDLGYLKNLSAKARVNREASGYPIRPLYTKLNDPQIYKAQLLAIKEAKSYIYLHNSYLSDDVIIYELIKARKRGVDVRVILPIKGNHNIMNSNNVISANILFRNGIRVFFYPGMSHIKAAVYDGWLCTGSANFDKLSLVDNLELNLATSDKDTVDTLMKRLFEEDFKKSFEMKEELNQGWKERMAEFLAEHL